MNHHMPKAMKNDEDDWNLLMTKLILIKTLKPPHQVVGFAIFTQTHIFPFFFLGKNWLRLADTNYKPWNLNNSKHAKLNRGDSYVLCALCCENLHKFSLIIIIFFSTREKMTMLCFECWTQHPYYWEHNSEPSMIRKRVYLWAILLYFGYLQRLVCMFWGWINHDDFGFYAVWWDKFLWLQWLILMDVLFGNLEYLCIFFVS